MNHRNDISVKERVIVQFEPEQLERLRALASERGVSLAALVREATNALLDADERCAMMDRVRALSGRFHSGISDLARNHDKYLGQEEW